MASSPTFSTFLWFDKQADEAAKFYTSLFPNARITRIARWGEDGPAPKGSVMTVAFELGGQPFTALNGGPHHKFTPAVSIVVSCETQAEIDQYWEALTRGGTPGQCGWLEDRFGLSWQVVPASLGELLTDSDPARAARVGQAMMQMGKIDLPTLLRAQRGE